MSKYKKLSKTKGSDREPTLQDVINTVSDSFAVVATEMQDMKQDIAKIHSSMVTKDEFNRELGQIKSTINTIQDKIGTMVTKDEFKEELAQMETRLVTKDYLDDKMNDLRGDLTVSLRKEDQKVVTLVSVLQARKVLSKKDAQRVMAMELFPHTSN